MHLYPLFASASPIRRMTQTHEDRAQRNTRGNLAASFVSRVAVLREGNVASEDHGVEGPAKKVVWTMSSVEVLEARLLGSNADLNVRRLSVELELSETDEQALVDLHAIAAKTKSKKATAACLALHRAYSGYLKQGRLVQSHPAQDAAAGKVQDWLVKRYRVYMALLAATLLSPSTLAPVSEQIKPLADALSHGAERGPTNFNGSH
jgi:hypothetical protein